MILDNTKYVIVKKGFPIHFMMDGEEYDSVEDVFLFGDKKSAEEELNKYDEPNEFEIIQVKVSYEF